MLLNPKKGLRRRNVGRRLVQLIVIIITGIINYDKYDNYDNTLAVCKSKISIKTTFYQSSINSKIFKSFDKKYIC